jgi:hypothetical protein
MKTLLLLALAGCVFACSSQKEIQMNMAEVQLVKIDTIKRYPSSWEQLLTWRSTDNVSYITYEPIDNKYAIGSKMTVMVRR